MLNLITTRRPLTIFFCISLVVVAVSCSSDEPEEPTVTPTIEPPSPQEILDNARLAIADVPQFEFELTHPQGTTSLDGGLELRRAEGTVISPGRLQVKAEANLGRLFVKVEAIVIDGQTWMTNPLSGNWTTIAPEDSPFSFLDPVQLVTNVLAQTTDPVYRDGVAPGASEYILNGRVPSEALQPLVGTVLPGTVLDVELTVDAQSFLMTQARLTGRLQLTDEDNYVRLITLSGFDADLAIEPPI